MEDNLTTNTSSIKPIGRVRYVEPNYNESMPMYGPHGLHSYEFENPMEDYCIYVNLKVEVRGRSIRTDYTGANNQVFSLNYVAEQGNQYINFMQGTKYPDAAHNVNGKKDVYSLTTDYDKHLFFNDLVKAKGDGKVDTDASNELFGINSIDIQYNNYMVPEITIKFTDVRGASLFAAEEMRHSNTDSKGVNAALNQEIEGSFFKCFFTFPYPKFTLTVKGFYGKPVAYELTCSDFRASFNSETGNFEATAKFVGYFYSFLGDVMMNALTAAPYSDYLGKQYWEDQVKDNRFTLTDVNNNVVPMMTLGQFVANVDKAMSTISAVTASSPEAQEQQELANKKEGLTGITQAYTTYISTLKTMADNMVNQRTNNLISGYQYVISEGNNLLCEYPYMPYSYTFEKSYGDVSNPNDDSKHDLKDAYDSLLSTAQNLSDGKYTERVKKLDYKELKPIQIYTKQGTKYKVNEIFDKYPSIKNALHKNVEILNSLSKEYAAKVADIEYAYVFIDSNLAKDVSVENQQTDADIQKNQEDIAKATEKEMADCLGFNPSVENITRIIMAHFETLSYMVTKCARDITGQSRTLESLGITSENVKDVGVSDNDKIIPPFPKVTKKVSEGGVEKDEEAWIGDFGGDWMEKDLVHGLLNGIKEVAELIGKAEAGEAQSESGSLTAIMKTPLCPLDLILDKNPYGGVNFTDKSSFAGHLILRMFAVLGLNGDNFQGDGFEKLGEAEAANFAKFFPTTNSEFKTWIQDSNVVKTIINIAEASSSTPVSQYGKNNKYAWENRKSLSTKNQPLMTNWTLTEFNGNNNVYLPVQNDSFNKVASDFNAPDANGKYKAPRNPNDYIFTNPNAYFASDKLYCIEPNVDRFSTIIENQCKDSGVDNLCKEMDEAAKYNASKYCSDNLLGHIKDYCVSCDSGATLTIGDDSPKTTAEEQEKNIKEGVTPQQISDWFRNIINKNGSGYESFEKDDTHDSSKVKVLFVPGVRLNDRYEEKSYGTLFTEMFYYQISDIDKAFSYLYALDYFINYQNFIDKLLDKSINFINAPQASILFVGGLCYYIKNGNKVRPKSKFFNKVLDNVLKKYNGIAKLRSDVISNLANYFKKWASSDYLKIDGCLSIKMNPDEFFPATRKMDLKDFAKAYLKSITTNYEALGNGFSDIENSDGSSSKYFQLGMKPDGLGCQMTTDLIFHPYTFLKTTSFFNEPSTSLSMKDGTAFVQGFISKLKEIYGTNETSGSTDIQRAAETDADNDIKIALYRYLKLLYDKWIAGSVFENEFTMEKFFEDDDRFFYFVDSYYNKVGNMVLVDVGKTKDEIIDAQTSSDYALLSFMAQMYADCKCTFLCVQNFMNLAEDESLQSVFKPVSFLDMGKPDETPNFIVCYTYEPSSHLDGDFSYENDSFSIKTKESEVNKWPAPLNSGEDCGYKLPAFGVSYGKMYQSYFKNISVSMENPIVTEQALMAEFEIASMNNQNSKSENQGTATRGMVTMGQDLFTIYSNASYTCEIDMMGDAWIQPLMYFELLNVPMFRGTYLIEKVSHHIEAGNMTTHITGVRMANTCTKLKKGWFYAAKPLQGGPDSEENPQYQYADVTNDCDYESNPLGGGVGGLLISKNGISALNYFESQVGSKWYLNGDNGRNLKDGAGITAGPGLTRNYLNYGKTASGLIKGFKAALKDSDIIVRKYIKGKKFSQKAIDSFFHLAHWSPNMARKAIPTFNNDNDAANWWIKKGTGVSGNYTGWEGFCKGWGWIIKGSEPSFEHNGQEARAKGGYDAYFAPNKQLLKALGYNVATSVNEPSNKGGKHKDIWTDFALAVHQTCMDTPSCGIDVEGKPISGKINEGIFTYSDRNKLANVFDIILNAYSSYIQNLFWVIDSENDVKGPKEIYVKVSESPSNPTVGMKVGSYAASSYFQHINKNSNQKYRRSIVKFYSKNGYYNAKDENKCVYGRVVRTKVLPTDWKELAPTACSTVMSGGGTGGVLDANKIIGNWNVGKACTHAMKYSSQKSKGQCGAYTETAIAAGGVQKMSAANADWLHYNGVLKNNGWALVSKGNSINDTLPTLQEGDVCISNIYQGKSAKGLKSGFHACLYCGSQWVSDYRQGNSWTPYGSKLKNWFLYRYSGSGMKSTT